MSNKTRLQQNNINLQSLVDKANSLPDSGSGSGSSSITTIGNGIDDMLGTIRSTASAKIVSIIFNDEIIIESTNFTSISSTLYRASLYGNVVAGSAITIITTGTVTMPTVAGFTLNTVYSDSNCKIYSYTAS